MQTPNRIMNQVLFRAINASAGAILIFSANRSIAQPAAEPAAVPPEVAIVRPSTAEVQQARDSLKKMLDSSDRATQALLKKYPDLITVNPPRTNSAVVPFLAPGFRTKHNNNVELAKKGDIDVLFMGDSITDFWRNPTGNFAGKPVFDKYYGAMKAANFGISGDTTQGVLFRLRDGE